jgi:hypothetical protein
VRFEFTFAAARVGLDDGVIVDGEGGEGVDGNEDDAGVGVDGAEGIAVKDGVKDCIEMGQSVNALRQEREWDGERTNRQAR